MRLRAACLLLPFAALAILAAGCGDTLSLDPVAKAADVSVKQTSEHMTMSLTVSAPTGSASVQASGDFQNTPLLGSMSMTATANGTKVQTDCIISADAFYMRSNLFAGKLPAGKSWVELGNYAAMLSKLGVGAGGFGAQSPSDAFAELKAAGHVTKDGPATIGSVATTHYSAILDPSLVAKFNKAAKADIAYGPVEVWIDGQGRVRRMDLTAIEGDTANPQATVSVSMKFSEYGEQVAPTIPPPSEVYEISAPSTP
jgi:hypothetical protein